jgi:hypothetical protein
MILSLTIAIAYLFVALKWRSIESALCLLVFVALASIGQYNNPIDDVYLFLFFCVIYSTLSYKLLKLKHLAAIGCLLMSIYSFVYALDSWINADYKTIIWENHEITVCILHLVILLLLSPIRLTVVRSSLYPSSLLYYLR